MRTLAIATILAALGATGFLAPARADVINAVFDCDGGLRLTVVFDNDKTPPVAVVTADGKEPQTLPIAMSGSGYYYSNGRYGLRGKGTDAMWEVGRMAPINCRQIDD